MRKLLLGLALVVCTRAVWADCTDTTFTLNNGNTPGGVWDPDASGFNNIFVKCASEATITVHLNVSSSATVKDTIQLANPIKISDRSGKTTALTMTKASGASGVNDSMFTLIEKTGAGSPTLLSVSAGNTVQINNMGFARKILNNTGHTVTIAAKNSVVTGCHFWMADNANTATGALLDISADTVLVERSLFRAPPDGNGRSTAIHTGGTASRVEIRANVFFSTGLQMAASGSFNVIANTFVGSRNEWNAIIIGLGIGTNYDNANILHNLFAPKSDNMPPIVFSGNPTSVNNILANAWSRGTSNLPLVVNSANQSVTLSGATGVNVNTPLPKGFSNYGPNSGDVKDYPVTELRSDPTLARKNIDFGKLYRVFVTGNWTGMSDVSTVSSRLYFTNPPFAPFLPGKSWLPSIKVGAFVDLDTYEIPSPLDSGAQGASLKFQAESNTRVKLTTAKFDLNYYKQTLLPDLAYFFFSNTLSKLTASNDTTALKAAAGSPIIKRWGTDDSLFTVPTSVRTGGDIYVKMVHFRGAFQAPVQSNAVIATITGFPSFPVNDLSLKVDTAASNFQNKVVALKVTRGSEAIDSIRFLALNEGGQVVKTDSRPASGSGFTFPDTLVDKGVYTFQAVPVAKVGGVPKAGSATPATSAVTVGITASDTIFVQYKSSTPNPKAECPTADGTSSLPFCSLDSAIALAAPKKGGTIIVRNGARIEDLAIAPANGADTSLLTITSGKFDENRPLIGGKNKEAVTITRKNVVLRGFTIEQAAGSTKTAMVIKAGGSIIDANIFRAASKGAVEAPAISVEVGSSAEARILNNVVWSYAKGVQILNSSSPNIRIMFNTFVADPAAAPSGKTSGVYLSGTDEVAAVVADNFFSGLADPIDTTLTGKKVVLDHNVYTQSPRLHGLQESGGLDSSGAVLTANLWATNYTTLLDNALSTVIDCNSLGPCNPLYAGGSTNLYTVSVPSDVFGRARGNRREVGAYEFAPSPSSVLGVLAVSTSLDETNFRKITYSVSGKTFDPDSKEADSVWVFWSTSDVTKSVDVNLSNIPSNQRKGYKISQLISGTISDVGLVDKENTKYWFYAALSRNTAQSPTGRKLGFAYSDTITTLADLIYDPDTIKTAKKASPSLLGGFGVDKGTWKDKFVSRVIFNDPVNSGIVNPPTFETPLNVNQFNLDISSPLPVITLNTKVAGLGVAKSKQMATWQIEIFATPDLSGLQLFQLPADANGMARLVPAWSATPISGGRTRITIETTQDGIQSYAFGKVQSALEPGAVASTDATPPVYDFDVARSVKAPDSIPVKFKASGFKTGNPLLLISIIPAGGTVDPGLTGKPRVISSGYHSRTLIASTGYADLEDSLKAARFYQHYLMAVAADATTPAPKGQKKPFTLETTTAADFASATDILDGDLAITGGEMGEMTVKVPVDPLFKDFDKYADGVGKASRSIEVEFTVFDGSKVGRTRAFIQTRFRETDVQYTEHYNRTQYSRSSNAKPHWNLFGYPWQEADTGSLARVVGQKKWEHDNMRLMQYKGAGEGFAAYIPYDGANNTDIKFHSGMAAWSGSTRDYTPVCLEGKSLDYQPFNLTPAPNQFTDMSLPFNFPIKWQDVLDSSKIAATNAPPMWHYKDSTRTWEAVQVFSASPPTPGTILMPWEGYTIKPVGPVTLTFPVMDADRSTTQVLPKAAANDGSWAVKVQASNATAAMELRIGRGNRPMIFPEAPDIPGQDFRVALAAGNGAVSQQILPLADGWQGHWTLRGTAAKGSGGISLRLLDATRPVPVWLVDAMHGTVTALSTEQSVQVSENDLQANDYHLVAGDKDYALGVLQTLSPDHLLALSNYPNPFAASTLIRYALPAGFGKTTFDLKVRDFRGRTVWEKTVTAGNSLSLLWDGHDRLNRPLPAGVYTLSLTAKAEGKPAYRAVRNLLRM